MPVFSICRFSAMVIANRAAESKGRPVVGKVHERCTGREVLLLLREQK